MGMLESTLLLGFRVTECTPSYYDYSFSPFRDAFKSLIKIYRVLLHWCLPPFYFGSKIVRINLISKFNFMAEVILFICRCQDFCYFNEYTPDETVDNVLMRQFIFLKKMLLLTLTSILTKTAANFLTAFFHR